MLSRERAPSSARLPSPGHPPPVQGEGSELGVQLGPKVLPRVLLPVLTKKLAEGMGSGGRGMLKVER